MDETLSPSTINDFDVLKQVGKGAYGTVFKVRRRSDKKVYAMKTINISTMDKKGILSTLNEVRILCSLEHPNIAGYKDAFLNKNGKELCIIMEFIGGGDLGEKIAECKKKRYYINEEIIWKYTIQTLLGLKVLHDMKIIHRDIKSANLFLTEDYETLKVGDLNVAKIAKNDLASTQIGTPYYLAPEIWQNKVYDYRCDVFSLGCVMYEMAALKVPFEAVSLQDLFKKITKGTIKRLPSRYSDELYDCIKLFLEKNPKRRPTVDEILSMPFMRKKLEKLNAVGLVNDKKNLAQLMGTIVVPRNMNQLKNKLPQKRYRAQSCKNIKTSSHNTPKSIEKQPIRVDDLINDLKRNKRKSRRSIERTPKKKDDKILNNLSNYVNDKKEPNSDKKNSRLPPMKKSKNLPPVKVPQMGNKYAQPNRYNYAQPQPQRNRYQSPKVMQYKEYLQKINENIRRSRKSIERGDRENRFNGRGARNRVSSADNVRRNRNPYAMQYKPQWWG